MRKILTKVVAALIAVALIGTFAACGDNNGTTTAAGSVTEGDSAKPADKDKGVVVAGIDGNFIALKSIKEGKIFGSAYDWSILQGYDAVYQAIDLLDGKTVPEKTSSPDTIITLDNIDQFYPHGEELDAWTIGDPITGLSDYIVDFIATGEAQSKDYNPGTGEVKNKGYKLGLVVKTATNAHFQDICYGAAIAAYETGCTITMDYCNAESEVLEQVEKCENMISSGIDALILTANDSNGVSAAVQAAHDAKIPFVTVDTEITNEWGDKVKEYLPNYIGVDHEQMAYELAKAAFERVGNEGNVVIMRGVDAASSSNERTAGFRKAIEDTPGMTLVDEQSGEYDQDKAAQKMSDMLQGNAKNVDVVLCCNDLMACGVQIALEENGYTVSPR